MTVEEKRSKLGFLKSRISLNKTYMTTWLSCDEFVERMWEQVIKGVPITDETALDVMRPLYDEILQFPKDFPGFEVRTAGKAMRHLERRLIERR